MQILIYRNGQQSGPFSPEQIKAQLASGALQPGDLAWYEGAADWMPLSSVPGIAAVPPPALPRPVDMPMARRPIPMMAQPQSTSGLAIASMILGLLGFFLSFLAGIPAIICGHVALSKIKRAGGALGGKGMAITGLVTGYGFSTFYIAILAGIALPVFAAVREKGLEVKSITNVRQIVVACKLYAVDNGGKFPDNVDQLYPTYLKDQNLLIDPMDPTGATRYEYFGGKDTDPPEQVLLQSKIVKHNRRVEAFINGVVKLVIVQSSPGSGP
ncbi:MAG TPA: DUF4190 domain-containing protein [Chthoniobacteraceae bacterium]|nr:DUF4190 domain-containing protein [Chthoniobacteraceae bacterium]